MKCYRKNGSDTARNLNPVRTKPSLNEVLPKER